MNPLSQSKIPTNKSLWIMLAVVILIIAGYGIYAYVSGNTNNANNANSTANTNQAINTNVSVNTNSTININSAANSNNTTNSVANLNTNSVTNTNIDTSGWKTYENDELGFSFKYPPKLGDVQFKITEGTTGQKFKGAFSQSDAIAFGGDSPDYSFPTEAGFLDTYGYTQKDGQYYMYLPTSSPEVEVALIKQISNPTANGIMFVAIMYDIEMTEAIFHLASSTFPGIGFLLKDENKISLTEFEQILETFKKDKAVTNANINDSNVNKNNWGDTHYSQNNISFSISIPNDWKKPDIYFEPRERWALIHYFWPPIDSATKSLSLSVVYYNNDDDSLKQWVDKHEVNLRGTSYGPWDSLALSEIKVNNEIGYVYTGEKKREIGKWDDEGNYLGPTYAHSLIKFINFEKEKLVYQLIIGGDYDLYNNNLNTINQIIESFRLNN